MNNLVNNEQPLQDVFTLSDLFNPNNTNTIQIVDEAELMPEQSDFDKLEVIRTLQKNITDEIEAIQSYTEFLTLPDLPQDIIENIEEIKSDEVDHLCILSKLLDSYTGANLEGSGELEKEEPVNDLLSLQNGGLIDGSII